LESLVLPKTALLILQFEVSRCDAKGTSFLLRETDILLDQLFEQNDTILPLPSSKESIDDQFKSIHELFRLCQVFERLLVVHCVRHLRDFHGRPEISHTIKKPVYEREHCHHKPVLSAGKFQCFARLETKLNDRSLLHHYELSQRSARYKILNTSEHERQEKSD
jgi:hypothetical protein